MQVELKVRIGRRELMGAAGAAMAAVPLGKLAAAVSELVVTPEQFGAAGDGRTNDTRAFADMTAFVNARGGGTVAFGPKTYIVGLQQPMPQTGYAFGPAAIMDFRGCTRPLTIRGNNACIRCADGLRYGTFDPVSGRATEHPLPYYRGGALASPYFAMLKVEECAGAVQISDLELDGNADSLRIGGHYGNAGWQIGCAGIRLKNNFAPVTIRNLRSHHHAQDGGSGDGHGRAGVAELVVLENCRFSYNGRNGWSMVGGVGWTFDKCVFEKSARSLPFPGSAPKAGIDFEAEGGKRVAQIHLVDCIAEDNAGAACLHPGSGRASDIVWNGGQIVGTTTWSYRGGGNRGIRFTGTLFLGALINLGSERFDECTFSDELGRSPTRELYNPNGFIIPDAVATNRFIGCTVIHSRPGSSMNGNFNQPLFENCLFYSKVGGGRLDVYGHFRGSGTHFIAERGGTDFTVTPAARGGTKSAGHAEDSFSVTSSSGRTITYPPG